MYWAAAVLVLATQGDPRIEVARLLDEGRTRDALSTVEHALAERRQEVEPLGFDYLHGHLLEAVGRDQRAHEAFVRAMSTTPVLAPYSRYRLALNQERQDHPEVAAGLLATLLGSEPPETLVQPAAERLAAAVVAGADCRLLGNADGWRIEPRAQRLIEVARADCEAQSARSDDAVRRLLALVEADSRDDAARLASSRLSRLVGRQATSRVSLLLGRTFHHHRQFDHSTHFLRRGLEQAEEPDPEALYALARSHFWRSEYLLSAAEFGRVASLATRPENKARALYQQGRCYELDGAWDAARSSFRLAYLADPDGRWADAALLSALRIEWRTGSEASALELYETLAARREWSGLFEKASVFLASSEIVRGRGTRAEDWLARASRARRQPLPDVDFWRARLEEQKGNLAAAAELYLELLTDDPLHPLARAAERRLTDPAMLATSRSLGRRLAGGDSTADLYGAMLIADDALAIAARQTLETRLRSRSAAAPYLDILLREPETWPLFSRSLDEPEEILLALGMWSEGGAAALRHFPADDPGLALAAADRLARAGSHHRAVRIAEILYDRARAAVPVELLSPILRRRAFPMPYQQVLVANSRRHGVDPFLLSAIVREESRFDAGAISAAAARGLTQFVIPTAERLAGRIGLATIRPEDLHRPEISLALGAAYLDELDRRFGGQTYAVVAAYNAGENQAALWQSYCFSREPEEYFSKVGFPETRGYLEKVLSSREHYTRLYARPL